MAMLRITSFYLTIPATVSQYVKLPCENEANSDVPTTEKPSAPTSTGHTALMFVYSLVC
jgi:hypothetical protein